MFNIGVTGTSHGATEIQLATAVERIALERQKHERIRVCQGCCIGFDEQLTEALVERVERELLLICAHPPTRTAKMSRRALELSNHICTAADYLTRDRRIVSHGNDLVLAAPRNYKFIPSGSGTWYTTKFAVVSRRTVDVIYPNGTVKDGFHAINGGTA
jgi:hypothetical protein